MASFVHTKLWVDLAVCVNLSGCNFNQSTFELLLANNSKVTIRVTI